MIREYTEDRRNLIDLLFLADEQEEMVERYIDRGTMYVIDDDGIKAEFIVTDEGDGELEIKNIAVFPAFQGKGYGKMHIDFIAEKILQTIHMSSGRY